MATLIRVPSSSSDMEYLVDPVALTCECRDWTDRRQQFPRTDPRRLCKHLLEAILGEGSVPDCLAKYEDTFYRYTNYEQRGFPLAQVWTTVRIYGQNYDIFLPPPNESWINIYSDNGKWGYHRFEERWSYDEEPGVSEKILNVVKTLEGRIGNGKSRKNKVTILKCANFKKFSDNKVIICPFCSMEFNPEDVAREISCPICGERLDGKSSVNMDQSHSWQENSSLSTPWELWIKVILLLIGVALLLGWCVGK